MRTIETPDRSTLILLPLCEAAPDDGMANGWAGSIPPRSETSEEEGPAHPHLTRREIAVLQGLAAGLSMREIALQLMVFEPAIQAALRSVCRKLGVENREEAVARLAAQRTAGDPRSRTSPRYAE